MERKEHQAEQLEILARETALKSNCEAVEWWRDKDDPRRLIIKAKARRGKRKSFFVMLQAVVPQQTKPYLKKPQKSLNFSVQKPFRLCLLQRL